MSLISKSSNDTAPVDAPLVEVEAEAEASLRSMPPSLSARDAVTSPAVLGIDLVALLVSLGWSLFDMANERRK